MTRPTGGSTGPPPSASGHVSLFGVPSAFISATAARFSASAVVVVLSFATTSWPKCTSLQPKKESADADAHAGAKEAAAAWRASAGVGRSVMLSGA